MPFKWFDELIEAIEKESLSFKREPGVIYSSDDHDEWVNFLRRGEHDMDEELIKLANFYDIQMNDEPGCTIILEDGTERKYTSEDSDAIFRIKDLVIENNKTKIVGYNIFPQLELNIVVINDYIDQKIAKHLFGEEKYYLLHSTYDMYDILWMFGIFKSKSEARKNWKRTGREIPPGYNEFKNIGKQKKSLYIWNPIGDEE